VFLAAEIGSIITGSKPWLRGFIASDWCLRCGDQSTKIDYQFLCLQLFYRILKIIAVHTYKPTGVLYMWGNMEHRSRCMRLPCARMSPICIWDDLAYGIQSEITNILEAYIVSTHQHVSLLEPYSDISRRSTRKRKVWVLRRGSGLP
jgi:hypothetical protein